MIEFGETQALFPRNQAATFLIDCAMGQMIYPMKLDLIEKHSLYHDDCMSHLKAFVLTVGSELIANRVMRMRQFGWDTIRVYSLHHSEE